MNKKNVRTTIVEYLYYQEKNKLPNNIFTLYITCSKIYDYDNSEVDNEINFLLDKGFLIGKYNKKGHVVYVPTVKGVKKYLEKEIV